MTGVRNRRRPSDRRARHRVLGLHDGGAGGQAGRAQVLSMIEDRDTAYGRVPLPAGIRSRMAANGNALEMHLLEAGFDEWGRPCALLLHGFPELAYSWRRVMPALAQVGFHVIAPDQRGYGRTTGWDPDHDGDLASYRLFNLVRDVMGLLDALGRTVSSRRPRCSISSKEQAPRWPPRIATSTPGSHRRWPCAPRASTRACRSRSSSCTSRLPPRSLTSWRARSSTPPSMGQARDPVDPIRLAASARAPRRPAQAAGRTRRPASSGTRPAGT